MARDEAGRGPKLLLMFALVIACLLPFAPYFLHLRTLSLHPIFFPISCIVALPLIVVTIYSILRCNAVDEEARAERADQHERKRLMIVLLGSSFPPYLETMATESSIASAFADAAKGGSSFPADQLAISSRTAGASPSLAELKACATKCSGGVTAPVFAEFCKQTSHKDSPEDLLSFFRSMDLAGTGKVKKADVKKCVMSFGECLTVVEADGVLEDMFPGQEEINYDMLVQKLIQ